MKELEEDEEIYLPPEINSQKSMAKHEISTKKADIF